MTPEEALKNVKNPEQVYLMLEAMMIQRAIADETEDDCGLRDWFIDAEIINASCIEFINRPQTIAECLKRKHEFSENIQQGLEVVFR